MKQENELQIFGYINPEPPIEGSWADGVFRLVEEAEKLGIPEIERHIVNEFAETMKRMREAQRNFFAKHYGLRLTKRAADG